MKQSLQKILLLLLSTAVPAIAHAQATVTVNGTVYDSIANKPLAGATVQLAPSDNPAADIKTVVSDSLGSFVIPNVVPGVYKIGFFHPTLDSLGVDAPSRTISVKLEQSDRVELSTPTPTRIRRAICGRATETDSLGVLVGFVRDAATGAPISGAKVASDWLEFRLHRTGLERRPRKLEATTGDYGWFAICSLPRGGTVVISATRASDSTDRVEVQIPASGLVNRELFIAESRIASAADTGVRTTTSAVTLPPVRLRSGEGRVSGKIIAEATGAPIADAVVTIASGQQTRTDQNGAWSLSNLPEGTRTLEVRAVGYYPERRAVNVLPATKSLTVPLRTMQSVLATVHIRARLNASNLKGFEERRKTGVGRYLTTLDVERRMPQVTSDIFKSIAGLRVDYASVSDTTYSLTAFNPGDDPDALPYQDIPEQKILMRSTAATWCVPPIYINGQLFNDVTTDQLNTIIGPKEVAAVEVYRAGEAPQEYIRSDGCGVVLIWTK